MIVLELPETSITLISVLDSWHEQKSKYNSFDVGAKPNLQLFDKILNNRQ